MNRPQFEPQPDNTFRIVYPSDYYASSALLRKIGNGEFEPADAETRLKQILEKYPWNFEAAYTLSVLYTDAGKFEKACEVRFKACQKLMELLPDDDSADALPLDFEKKESQYPLFLLHGSAIDHFLIGEFEMAAALLETLLDLDEEDHLDVSQTLAYCYIALDEADSFHAILPDLDDKSAEKALAQLWAQQRFHGEIDPASWGDFQKKYPSVFAELTGEEHNVTPNYLDDIDSDHPSRESRARLLWLRTEHLWQQFPEFIMTLKKSIPR